jgi:hypothetical protein
MRPREIQERSLKTPKQLDQILIIFLIPNDASGPDMGLSKAQQIKVARPPTVLRHTHSEKGPIAPKD